MQRILNNPDNIVDEMLEGFLRAHPDMVTTTKNPRSVKSVFPVKNRVGVVTGGGSGHKPAFIGFCGKNLCDGIAVGEICSSPTAQQFLDAFTACDGGKGVACLYGNYSGDNMNVKMAVKEAKKIGLTVKTVVCNDDVASAPFAEREKRRGIAGEVVMYKCGGAAAATGASLDEVIRIAQKAVDWTRSGGIGLTPCTLPAVGHPNFEIKPGTMEVGVGPHGEPGMRVQPLETAAGMAKIMADVVLGDFENDLPIRENDEIVVLINGMGATPLNELYVLFNEVAKIMDAKGIKIYKSYVGNFLTSMDMMGASLTVTKLDDELKKMFDMPCYSMGLKQGEVSLEEAQETEETVETEAAAEAVEEVEAEKKEVEEEDVAEGQYFSNKAGKSVLLKMVKGIQANKDFLGEVDGLIGDGDHGMNMNKGFTVFEERFGDSEFSFSEGLTKLSQILFKEIGGSMGPIYGTTLGDMADAIEEAGKDKITLAGFADALEKGLEGLQDIVGARVGDKTLVDALSPAVDSLKKDAQAGTDFAEALDHASAAALAGRDSTKNLVAKFGRSSRLGERSRGVLDAGSCSCYIIINAMAEGVKELL